MDIKKNIDTRSLQVFNLSLPFYFEKIASCISEEDFIKTLPAVIQQNKSRGSKLYNIYKNVLIENFTYAWESICDENDLQTKVNTLKQITQHYSNTTHTAWRPVAGDCEQQLRSHCMKDLIQQKNDLEKYVVTLEEKVAKKVEKIKKNRKTISDIYTKCENHNSAILTVYKNLNSLEI